MRMWKDVATLVKTRSLNGRFVARVAADFPFIIAEGTQVAFVPPQTDLPRDGRVTFVRDIDGVSYEVGFDSVTGDVTARGLIGCHCLVIRADLGDCELSEERGGYVGWRVVEADGNAVGDIESIVEKPGQSLLEVRRENGRTAYIPLVDEFICDIDEEQHTVHVDLPAGLLDL